MKKAAKQGGEVVLIDGTLIPKDSGKHRRHGLHFLAPTDENGRLTWISAARPGSAHDITAARHDHVLAHLRAADLGTLAVGRAPIEHDFAHLKNWLRTLTKLRTDPAHRIRTFTPQRGDRLAELTRAQPGERTCPGRLRRRDHTSHDEIISVAVALS